MILVSVKWNAPLIVSLKFEQCSNVYDNRILHEKLFEDCTLCINNISYMYNLYFIYIYMYLYIYINTVKWSVKYYTKEFNIGRR